MPLTNLVLVEWVDSHHRPGWTSDPPDSGMLLCKSVGWVILRTKDVIVLGANVTQEDVQQRCSDMTIPMCCVKRIIKLTVPLKENARKF